MDEKRPRIELPAQDSIYDYLLNTVFPNDLKSSPFYKVLERCYKNIYVLDYLERNYDGYVRKNFPIHEPNLASPEVIVERLREWVRRGHNIYSNLKNLIDCEDDVNMIADKVRHISKGKLHLKELNRLIIDYTTYFNMYNWYHARYHDIKDICSAIKELENNDSDDVYEKILKDVCCLMMTDGLFRHMRPTLLERGIDTIYDAIDFYNRSGDDGIKQFILEDELKYYN